MDEFIVTASLSMRKAQSEGHQLKNTLFECTCENWPCPLGIVEDLEERVHVMHTRVRAKGHKCLTDRRHCTHHHCAEMKTGLQRSS